MATQNPPFERDNPLSAIPVYLVGPGGVSSQSLGFDSAAITNAAAIPLPGNGAVPAGAAYAVVSSPVAFNWRADGAAPTGAAGIAQPANTPLTVGEADFAEFQAIGLGAASTLNVNYYGLGTSGA